MSSDFFVLRIQSFKSNEAKDIFSNEKWNHKHHNFYVNNGSENFFIIGFFFILSDAALDILSNE